jgi:SAM-dependent methyltransferase
LLGEITDDTRRRYFDNYERLAEADLAEPLERHRAARHARLVSFIGDVRGKTVLEIGSSNGLYLRRIDASFKVAFDIALPYLRAMPAADKLAAVCGDAEKLPFRQGFFAVVILSDVLEHVLDPQAVVDSIARISEPGTRVIVEVPWEEDLSSYGENAQWEFTHLRSFDLYKFSTLWSRFQIVRMRSTVPRLDFPLFLQGRHRLPLRLLNRLRLLYHHHGYAEPDFAWRTRRLERLPRHDALLTAFSRPLVRQFELTPFPADAIETRPTGGLDRIVERSLRLIYRY